MNLKIIKNNWGTFDVYRIDQDAMYYVCTRYKADWRCFRTMKEEIEKLFGNSTNLDFLSDDELYKLTASLDEVFDSLDSDEIKELIKILTAYQY